ncbi:MAG: alpha/beta hydrolase [Mucilaginibacter sp.]|nr:alpha/beta hydrolase [Mucilaginibacter sp.]
MSLVKLPFKSIVVGSTNDFYVTAERAKLFADSWGSEFISVGDAGHINVGSGFGEWDKGLEILKQLD